MTQEASHDLAPTCLPHLISHRPPPPVLRLSSFLSKISHIEIFSNWALVPFLFLIYFIPVSEINQWISWLIMKMMQEPFSALSSS